MSTVLFATDLSGAASVAERLVTSIRWPAGTTIRVVNVLPWLGQLSGAPWMAVAPANAGDLEASQQTWAEARVREIADRFDARGLDATWIVMRGQAADAIVHVARTEAVDLIIVGSRGLGAVEGALLGSVSEAVADKAPCPVLVARSAAIRRTLVADDGSAGAELALDYVRERPHLLGDHTRLIGVVGLGEAWADSFDMPIDSQSVQVLADDQRHLWNETRSILERDAIALRSAGETTDVELDSGSAGPCIVDAARTYAADLVVVGSRHRIGVTRLVLGSVGRHVLHHTHCSVLLVGRPGVAPSRPRVVAEAIAISA